MDPDAFDRAADPSPPVDDAVAAQEGPPAHTGARGDDDPLVAAARAGDPRAFERLVDRHAPRIWRLARYLLGNDADAEEATWDTFLRAHRGLATWRGDGPFGVWLATICRRTCIDRLRIKRLPVVPLDSDPGAAGPAVAAPPGEDVELRLVLAGALAGLAPEEREAFGLVDVLGFSRVEAAAIVGVPPSTMRSRLSRARRRLVDALAGTVGPASAAGAGSLPPDPPGPGRAGDPSGAQESDEQEER